MGCAGWWGAEEEEDEHGGPEVSGREQWTPGRVQSSSPPDRRETQGERLQVGACTPQASRPKSRGPQTRPPTSVAKNPLGRCLPRDARPPTAGLSLALMVC